MLAPCELQMASLLPNPLLHPLIPQKNMHVFSCPAVDHAPGRLDTKDWKGTVLFRRSRKTYTNNSSEKAPQGRSFPPRWSSFSPPNMQLERNWIPWGREGLLLTAPESASRRSKDSAATWQTSWDCWLLAIVNQLWGSRWPSWMWKLQLLASVQVLVYWGPHLWVVIPVSVLWPTYLCIFISWWLKVLGELGTVIWPKIFYSYK